MVAETLPVMLLLMAGMLLAFSCCERALMSALALPVAASGFEGNLLLPMLVLGLRDPPVGILEGRAPLDLLPAPISEPGDEGSPGEAAEPCMPQACHFFLHMSVLWHQHNPPQLISDMHAHKEKAEVYLK